MKPESIGAVQKLQSNAKEMLNVQMLETPCVCLYFGWVHGSIENKEVFLYFKFLLLIMRKSKKVTRKPKFIFWFRLKVSKEITGNKNIAPFFSSPFSKVKKLNLLWQDTFFSVCSDAEFWEKKTMLRGSLF